MKSLPKAFERLRRAPKAKAKESFKGLIRNYAYRAAKPRFIKIVQQFLYLDINQRITLDF
jgi:hypothetical protein